MSLDFEKEATRIAEMVAPADQQIRPSVVNLATQALVEIDSKYGVDSPAPLTYHNAEHAIDVCRRGVRLGNILYPYIRPRYRESYFNLIMISGSTHDLEQKLGSGHNERISAEGAVQLLQETDDKEIINEVFRKRVREGILATTVDRRDDGELVQSNLQSGTHDPLKFNLSFADINGTAMEGSRRMFRDATNLCYERFDEPSIDDIYNFYINQAAFLKQRLNDSRIKSDIAYYFPHSIEEVYTDMRKAFNKNIISAYSIAVALGEKDELKSQLELPLRVLDKAHMGVVAGKLLSRALGGRT